MSRSTEGVDDVGLPVTPADRLHVVGTTPVAPPLATALTAQIASSSNAREGESLVDLARVHALSSTAAMRDESLKPQERTSLADAYVAKALDLLQGRPRRATSKAGAR